MVELRFFATFRSAVGQKSVERDYEVTTVGEVLSAVEDEWPELAGDVLDDGSIRPGLSVLKNGREVAHMEGTDTPVDDGDTISVFPPVAGGDGCREGNTSSEDGIAHRSEGEGSSAGDARQVESYRGISKRLAGEYLENLGGERVDEDTVAGDGWRTALSAETVDVAGSIQLTEVTVVFEGEAAVLEGLVEDFTRKAMRAGG
jgi:molybdopterin synthase sulfur carrier subunit